MQYCECGVALHVLRNEFRIIQKEGLDFGSKGRLGMCGRPGMCGRFGMCQVFDLDTARQVYRIIN